MDLQKLTKKDPITQINSLNSTISKLKAGDDFTEEPSILEEVIQLGQILDTSLNEILIFDTETFKFVFVNESARSNLRYTIDEFYSMTPLDINPELTQDSAIELVEPLINGEKKRLNFETTLKRKDGSTYPVYVVLQLSYYKGEKVFISNTLDITDLKKALNELQESEKKYKS